MENVTQDETPTKPVRRPFDLPLKNGFRRVLTNSVQHDRLLELGYLPVEEDDKTTILRPVRRADDLRVTNVDLARYREHERGVLEQLAAEANVARNTDVLDAALIWWFMDEFRSRVMRETNSTRTQVNGRLR